MPLLDPPATLYRSPAHLALAIADTRKWLAAGLAANKFTASLRAVVPGWMRCRLPPQSAARPTTQAKPPIKTAAAAFAA